MVKNSLIIKVEKIKRKIFKCRIFLIKNEIFLTSISIFLSVLTLFSTLLIAKRTETISENQMTIEKNISNPLINCKINYNETFEKIDNINISIKENPSENIDVKVKPVYCIRLGSFKKNNTETYNVSVSTDCLLLPISKFKKVIVHNTNIGDICTIEFSHDDECLAEFKEGSPSIPIFSNSSEIISVGLVYFIEITYTDVLGEKKNKVYFCKPNLVVKLKGSFGFQSNELGCSFSEITNNHSLYEFYQSNLESKCVLFDSIITIDESFFYKFVECSENAIENNQFFQI